LPALANSVGSCGTQSVSVLINGEGPSWIDEYDVEGVPHLYLNVLSNAVASG